MKRIIFISFGSLFLLGNVCHNMNQERSEGNNPDEQTTLSSALEKVTTLTESVSKREATLMDLIRQIAGLSGKSNDSTKAPNKDSSLKEDTPDLVELAHGRNKKALQQGLIQTLKSSKGTREVSNLTYNVLHTNDFPFVLRTLKSTLKPETFHTVLAYVYFRAAVSKDSLSLKKIRLIFKSFSSKQKEDIISYMMFINSSEPEDDHKEAILAEIEFNKLDKKLFSKASGEIGRLKKALDEHVIGQNEAKITLSVAISNHYERLEKGLKKSNLLIMGPSGSGKTFMMETIAKELDVPFVLADSAYITQPGYVGGDVQDVVKSLYAESGQDPEKFRKGIIFFDEIDKMASRAGRREQDEFKRQAQASLLKLVEGMEVDVGRAKKINTKDVLVVCAGAFVGLDEIIQKRLSEEGATLPKNLLSRVSSSDLVKYGLMPELLGRLPNHISLQKLTLSDFVKILKKPKASVLEEYKKLFELYSIELKFTDMAIQAIAEDAAAYDVGARALRTVVENVMAEVQYQLNQVGEVETCTITERVVRFQDFPIITYRKV